MNKKGNSIAIVAIILAITVLTVFLVSIAQRECNANKDCPSNAYCNTKYECVEYPEHIVVKDNSYLPAALVLGFAIIIAVLINKGKIPKIRKKE